jgi:hypothetical protein
MSTRTLAFPCQAGSNYIGIRYPVPKDIPLCPGHIDLAGPQPVTARLLLNDAENLGCDLQVNTRLGGAEVCTAIESSLLPCWMGASLDTCGRKDLPYLAGIKVLASDP